MRIPKLCYAVVFVLPALFSGCADDLPHKTEIDPALAKDLPPPGPERPNPFAAKGSKKQKDHVGDLSPMMPPR
ncbi:hypothetical protein [Paludisphaera borealis]|uniref:Lipoprotein n=1 Tax=Paludisphaera borealis TaxID=1387353 RepID=A0A1U7CPQ7_9BACT|nr:hypothetical protein [Paludisphaera borealis]APW60930.1 hypothetical protein BSF38_02424 [Paludisphaera borealis]